MTTHSSRLLRVAAPIVAVAAIALATFAPGESATALTNCTVSAAEIQLNSDEQAFLTLINDYRSQNGVGALTPVTNLNRSSAWLSNDMQASGYFSHTEPSGRGFSQRITDCGYPTGGYRGENIAAGYTSAAAVFEGWRNSSGHNTNMLSANFTTIGIGKVGSHWTTDFGSVADVTAPAPAQPTSPPPTQAPTEVPQPTNPPVNTPTPAPTNPPAATPTSVPASPTDVPSAPAPASPSGGVSAQAQAKDLFVGFNFVGPSSSITPAEFVSCLGDSWSALWYYEASTQTWRWHFPEGDGPGQVPAHINDPAGNGIGTIPGGRGVALYITEDLTGATIPTRPGEGCTT